MLWGCFTEGGTCALHKIDGINGKENYVDILKQHLKTSARKLKLGRKWVFHFHISKVVAKWLKDNKVKVLMRPSQSPDLSPSENLWTELKKCVRAWSPTNLTQLHQLCQEEWAKIHLTYCGKLVEGNIWPKLNNFKAMLPNTNWVYVNFWPTGNVMTEIKAEINHSLYYSTIILTFHILKIKWWS